MRWRRIIMGLIAKDKMIDGRKITVTTFPARNSLTLKNRIIKLMGEPAVQLLSGFKNMKKIDLKKVDVSVLIPVVEKLVQNLDPDEFVQLCMDLFVSTRIDGKEVKPEVFDIEFSGNLKSMYKILFFIVEVNWGDFFDLSGIGLTLSPVSV
jgi:hypothetical protein